jgi:D-alanyl-D-alanine carboxypeptidase (penicillin-binding protein 5/6)
MYRPRHLTETSTRWRKERTLGLAFPVAAALLAGLVLPEHTTASGLRSVERASQRALAVMGAASAAAQDLGDRKALAQASPTPGPGAAKSDEPAIPAPEVVNARPHPKQPADTLDGPPFVTARAWAVVDGRTGELIGGASEAKPLEMASTTKMMTALVILRMARAHPEVMDEAVVFSRRADETTGSTSDVHAGERVPVRELMYGLLLPSGNDASVAFAEHFGGRLAPPGGSEKEADPFQRFVAEMNRLATELGMKETHFANPNGLPAEGHQSSARDLAKLARLALAEPVFAACVATPEHGCTLVDGDGHRRNIVWTNTNHLLETEGYTGVKTGTTRAAGACLVGSGKHGQDQLIVVVLGSATSDARYIDARNLFRWGWAKRSRPGPQSNGR